MDNEEIFDLLNSLPRNGVEIFIYSHVLKIPPHIIAEKRNIALSHCNQLINKISKELREYPDNKQDEAISAIQELFALKY